MLKRILNTQALEAPHSPRDLLNVAEQRSGWECFHSRQELRPQLWFLHLSFLYHGEVYYLKINSSSKVKKKKKKSQHERYCSRHVVSVRNSGFDFLLFVFYHLVIIRNAAKINLVVWRKRYMFHH